MAFRRGGVGRPRGFGDSSWRPGTAEPASPIRSRPPTAKPSMGASFSAKVKSASGVPPAASPKPGPKKITSPVPRSYSPVSGGTTPEMFMPKFTAKIGGKGGGGEKKAVKKKGVVLEADDESVTTRDIPDTTPPISLEASNSLYDITDNTDVSVPVEVNADIIDVQDDLQDVPPMSPPIDDEDAVGLHTIPEDEEPPKSKKPTIIPTRLYEEDEDYAAFVAQQESMVEERTRQRARRVGEFQHHSLIDEYDGGQKMTRSSEPFGDYLNDQESESETFYTPTGSANHSVNKVDRKGELKLGKGMQPSKPSMTPDNRWEKGQRKKGMSGARPLPDAENTEYDDDEFLTAFSEQSARTSAVFVTQNVDDSDRSTELKREWRETKGSKGSGSKSPKSKGANVADKHAKHEDARGDDNDQSLGETPFEELNLRSQDIPDKGRSSTSPNRVKGAMMDKMKGGYDESDDPVPKKKQIKSQQIKKGHRTDAQLEEDSTAGDSDVVAESMTKVMKGLKKPSLKDEYYNEETRKNRSTKMTKEGSLKASSRNTTPSRNYKHHAESDSNSSEEPDISIKHKIKKNKLYSSEDEAKSPNKSYNVPLKTQAAKSEDEYEDNLEKAKTTGKKHGRLIQLDDSASPGSKSKPIKSKKDEFIDDSNDEEDRLKKPAKIKSSKQKRTPLHVSSVEKVTEDGATARAKQKKHLRHPPSNKASAGSQASDEDVALTKRKSKKERSKQTPVTETDFAKASTSSSTLELNVKTKGKRTRSQNEKSDSEVSTDESKDHQSRRLKKGKSNKEDKMAETDSSKVSLAEVKTKGRPQNKALEGSSESHLSLKEDVLSDVESTANVCKEKIPATDSDLPLDDLKHKKRSRSKSPPRKTPTRRFKRPVTPEESDTDELTDEHKSKKRNRKETPARRTPGKKSVSDDFLENVKQKVDKKSRRAIPDTSSFSSSDHSQTELDEEGSLLENREKEKKASRKGTKGKIAERELNVKRKHGKSHGKRESKSSLVLVDPKSKKIAKDSRDTKPSKQITPKATTNDTKTKSKFKDKSSKLASKLSEESSDASEDKKLEVSMSENEGPRKKSKNKNAFAKSGKVKKSEAELYSNNDQPAEKGLGESPKSKKKTAAIELQTSEASTFDSQRPKPVISIPGAVAPTALSLARRLVDDETGVQSEDFVSLPKQKLPTTSTATSFGQFSPKESLPQFRASLRKFMSKDVQTPIAKRIQTTPSMFMSEESVSLEDYSANILPKYAEKPREPKKHSKSVGIQQSVRKVGREEAASIGTDMSECNVHGDLLAEVLKHLTTIAEKDQSLAEESQDDRSQVDMSDEESNGGYSLYHNAAATHNFHFDPYSETSFDTRRRPTQESVFSRIPEGGSSIATVCPDPDKFVQVINISLLPSRIVAVEVTQDIGDGSSPPPPGGKLEFSEPTTALTFNVPLVEPCQGDHPPITDQHGRAWPQASTQRHHQQVPQTKHHVDPPQNFTGKSVRSKDGRRHESGRRQRGATTRLQRPSPVVESPCTCHPDDSSQRNQTTTAENLVALLANAQRLLCKSQ